LDPEILTRRAEIARAIDGQTLCGLLQQTAQRFADRPALSEPVPARDEVPAQDRPAAPPPGPDGPPARVEQVKRWRLLPQEWTSATGELTPTLKMRRPVIHASFAGVIDELYGA
jgi:hypothetical protein